MQHPVLQARLVLPRSQRLVAVRRKNECWNWRSVRSEREKRGHLNCGSNLCHRLWRHGSVSTELKFAKAKDQTRHYRCRKERRRWNGRFWSKWAFQHWHETTSCRRWPLANHHDTYLASLAFRFLLIDYYRQSDAHNCGFNLASQLIE